jgi:hypothetical protein
MQERRFRDAATAIRFRQGEMKTAGKSFDSPAVLL